MIKRRDFMKLLGAAVGGVMLPNCDGVFSSDGGPGGSLPNGYEMARVFSLESSLPDGVSGLDLIGSSRSDRVVQFLSGGLMMNDQSEIIFHCKDSRGARGWYAITMDYTTFSAPRAVSIRKLIREGDVLPDGKTVARVGNSDTNAMGSFATLAQTSDNLPSVYKTDGSSGALRRVAGFGDAVPEANGTFGGNIGNLSLDSRDNLLLTGHYADKDTGRSYDALYYLHGSQVDENGRILLRSDSLVPDADGVVNGVGIPCLHHDGHYVVQAQASHTSSSTEEDVSKSGVMTNFPTFLVKGRVDDSFSKELLAASPDLKLSSTARSRSQFENGDLIMGPRVGSDGLTAYVVHKANDRQVLYYGGSIVASTGYREADDTLVQTISAPVISEDGGLFYLLGTDHGMELWARAGGSSSCVLSAGVYGDHINGAKVNAIIHGTHSAQYDSQGRICFMVEFEDKTTSIVVGSPV